MLRLQSNTFFLPVEQIHFHEVGNLDAIADVTAVCLPICELAPEAIGFATEALLAAGALDVYTIPIGMKKNRLSVLLTCMCKMEQREEMIALLFQHTTTLGIREAVCNRYTLNRTMETVETAYSPIRVKKVTGWGVSREKAEYDDLARIAKANGGSPGGQK